MKTKSPDSSPKDPYLSPEVRARVDQLYGKGCPHGHGTRVGCDICWEMILRASQQGEGERDA